MKAVMPRPLGLLISHTALFAAAAVPAMVPPKACPRPIALRMSDVAKSDELAAEPDCT